MASAKSRQLTAAPAGINVLLYDDYSQDNDSRYKILEVGNSQSKFSAEELCLKAAGHLGIGSITFPMFSLYNLSKEVYLHPKAIVSSTAQECIQLVFRARFLPTRNMVSFVIFADDLEAAKYLYLQFRYDFLNSRLTYEKGTDSEHLLGLVVMDLVRYGKERHLSIKEICSLDLKPFLPISLRDRYKMPWEKKRLQNNLKTYVEEEFKKEKENTPYRLMKNFIIGLIGYIHKYGAETFNTAVGPKVCVEPYRIGKPAIYNVISEKEDVGICPIEELISVSLSEFQTGVMQVMLNRRNGQPEMLKFSSKDDAYSFTALLDGYYRLKEDYHHCLCPMVSQTSLLEELQKIGCHGPVSRKWAQEKLYNFNSTDVSYNYLLKQRRSSLNNYVLVYITPDKVVKFYMIQREVGHDGSTKYGIGIADARTFQSISELLKYYKSPESTDIKLKMCVRPTQPLELRLYLCREDCSEASDHRKRSKESKNQVYLISDIKVDGELGHGQFTEVYSSIWEKDKVIAVKRLRKESQVHLKEFMASIHKASFWSHATITTIHAICLAPIFTVLMECGELGPLDKYLREVKNQLDIYSLIMVGEQLAQALLYLESCHHTSDKGQLMKYHGNIRARNVVVFGGKDKPRIKLCDPGMVYVCSNHPEKLEAPENAERLPWIAPELYKDLSKMTIYSDRYAYGITLWEIMSQGDRPFKDMDSKDIINNVSQGRRMLQKPHQDCPDVIYNLMKQCWLPNPNARTSAKQIVRDICNLLQSDYRANQNVSSKHLPPRNIKPSAAVAAAAGIDAQSLSFADKINLPTQNGPYRYKLNAGTMAIGEPVPGLDGVSLAHHPSSLASDSMMSFSSTTPLVRMSESSDSGQTQFTAMTSVPDSGSSTSSFSLDDCKQLPPAEGKSALRQPFSEIPEMPEPQKPLSNEKIACDYSKESTLGDGHYGTVYKGFFITNHGNPRPVAIKRFKSSVVQGAADEFRKEFNIMMKLQHPRIVEIIGHCETPQFVLIMEFVENGSLNKYLQKYKNDLLQTKMFRFGQEIAEGMIYLGEKKIVHRDLAARNILVTKDDHMKISDFGLARVVEGDYYKLNAMKELPIMWTAPEGLMYKKYTTMSDVWSFGITMWEIFMYGDTPHYDNLHEISKLSVLLHEGHRLPKPRDCPEKVYRDVLLKCWEFKAKDRITFAELHDKFTELIQDYASGREKNGS